MRKCPGCLLTEAALEGDMEVQEASGLGGCADVILREGDK